MYLKYLSAGNILKLICISSVSIILWFYILLPLLTAVILQLYLWIYPKASIFLISLGESIAAGLSGLATSIIVAFFYRGKEINIALFVSSIIIIIFVVMTIMPVLIMSSPSKDYQMLETSFGAILLLLFSIIGAKIVVRIRQHQKVLGLFI